MSGIRTYDATIGGFRDEAAPVATPIALDEAVSAKDHEDLVAKVLAKVNDRLAADEQGTFNTPEGWPASGRFRLTFRLEPVQ